MNTQTETDYNFKGRIIVQDYKTIDDGIVNRPTKKIYSNRTTPIGKYSLCAMSLDEFMEIQKPRVLSLQISMDNFNLMKDGLMPTYFQKPGYKNNLRIIDKAYDYVKFVTWKFGKMSTVTVEYRGYGIADHDHYVRFNEGKRIAVDRGDFIIKLGRVITVSE